MIESTRILLCCVPADIWTADDGNGRSIAVLARDALACERRISKGVNLEDEFARYSLCCDHLESAVLADERLRPVPEVSVARDALRDGGIPGFPVPVSYLQVLDRAREAIGSERLGASFFPPEAIEAHRGGFFRWADAANLTTHPAVATRLEVLDFVAEQKCGLVEVLTGFHRPMEVGTAEFPKESISRVEEDAVRIPDYVFNEQEAAVISSASKRRMMSLLRAQMAEALSGGEPVNIGNQAAHDVITEVLNAMVFVPEEALPVHATVRIVYTDGSEAERFPLLRLRRDLAPVEVAPDTLHIALMSMRHPEMDPDIDFCWFRNRDVSRTRTLAETDQFCTEVSRAQLRECLEQGATNLLLYHTGFEPAVLGFYRALTELLTEYRARGESSPIAVTPMYYRGDRFEPGSVWR